MTTDERISALEQRVARYEELIQKAVMLAQLTPKGRMFLKLLGVQP